MHIWEEKISFIYIRDLYLFSADRKLPIVFWGQLLAVQSWGNLYIRIELELAYSYLHVEKCRRISSNIYDLKLIAVCMRLAVAGV
jgi:hypothetical protein